MQQEADGTALLYIDRHLVHEVTSPQAFEGLKLAGRQPWRVGSVVATADHNTPTTHWDLGILDPISRLQVETLDANIREYGARAYFPFRDPRQGIVHVIGPEQGATLPGMTVVCGDSHTSTHGAFGALAHGIGTSEVEHVLATQCLVAKKSNNMLVRVEGVLPSGVSAKDMALAIIGKIGTAGGTGYAIEFAGSAVRALTMEGRMTLCNMAIEAGARSGLVAVDQTTIDYVKGRPLAPSGANWERAVADWRQLTSDADAKFDAVVELSAEEITPQVTWGTSPEMVCGIEGKVPDPARLEDPIKRESLERALHYMLRGYQIDSHAGGFSVSEHTLSGRASAFKVLRVLPGDSLSEIAHRLKHGQSPSSPGFRHCRHPIVMNPSIRRTAWIYPPRLRQPDQLCSLG